MQEWDTAQCAHRGRGPLRQLKSLVAPFGWTPIQGGWLTASGLLLWREVSAVLPDLLQQQEWAKLAHRRSTYKGIEAGIDTTTIQHLHTVGRSTARKQQAILSAVSGGWWFGDRRQKVFDIEAVVPLLWTLRRRLGPFHLPLHQMGYTEETAPTHTRTKPTQKL